MKKTTIVPIHFVSTDGQNTWMPSISIRDAGIGNEARASARFSPSLSGEACTTFTAGSAHRSRVSVAHRLRHYRSRSAVRRFFTPNHTFEQLVP